MDLNRLYHDHQLSVIRAASAGPSVSFSFEVTAGRAASQIEQYQRSLGATAAGAWARLAINPQLLRKVGADPPSDKDHADRASPTFPAELNENNRSIGR
jgi:hypothetical protein